MKTLTRLTLILAQEQCSNPGNQEVFHILFQQNILMPAGNSGYQNAWAMEHAELFINIKKEL